MTNLDYENIQPVNDSEVFYVNNRTLSRSEIEKMSNKVRAILSSEENVNNPLLQIIPNKDEYNNIDNEAKSKYILELSKIYTKLRKKIVK